MRIGRIFSFDQREKEIYAEFLKNAECMLAGVKFLEKSILERRGKEHDKHVSKVIEYEKICDVKTFHIIEEILKVKHSHSRYELLRLNLSIEKVAKAIEATGHRVRMSNGIRFPDYLNQGLGEMAKATVKTVEALKRALQEMPRDYEKTLKYAEKVHEFEEEMDDVRRNSCNEFIHSKTKMSIQQYYIWHEIVSKMESVADSCDETANIIRRILAAKE